MPLVVHSLLDQRLINDCQALFQLKIVYAYSGGLVAVVKRHSICAVALARRAWVLRISVTS